MQTFLPYADFDATARCLDSKRLGNQCYRETKTLLCGGWANHPASRMWRGYETALAAYGYALAREMSRRGKWRAEVCVRWNLFYLVRLTSGGVDLPVPMPPWLGDPEFHARHRSNLLAKDPGWYGRFGWTDEPGLPYIWPV